MSTTAPRPAFLVLLGVAAIAAIFLFTQRGGGQEATAPSTPATQAPAAQPSAPATPADPAATPGTQSAAPAQPAPNPTAKPPVKPSPNAGSRDLPRPVERAMKANKVVVVLFWNPLAPDDREVRQAVAGLSRRGGDVAVFVDRPRRAYRYATITTVADLNHTPALLVVNRREEAKVVTGFLDDLSVEQQVVDALHGD